MRYFTDLYHFCFVFLWEVIVNNAIFGRVNIAKMMEPNETDVDNWQYDGQIGTHQMKIRQLVDHVDNLVKDHLDILNSFNFVMILYTIEHFTCTLMQFHLIKNTIGFLFPIYIYVIVWYFMIFVRNTILIRIKIEQIVICIRIIIKYW